MSLFLYTIKLQKSSIHGNRVYPEVQDANLKKKLNEQMNKWVSARPTDIQNEHKIFLNNFSYKAVLLCLKCFPEGGCYWRWKHIILCIPPQVTFVTEISSDLANAYMLGPFLQIITDISALTQLQSCKGLRIFMNVQVRRKSSRITYIFLFHHLSFHGNMTEPKDADMGFMRQIMKLIDCSAL